MISTHNTTETHTNGKVYLVGAGPGDPGLVTVRGKELLEQADVVVYDYLASPKLLVHAPAHAEKIYVGKKGGGCHAHTQEEINQMLVDHALAGKKVVRLKGGDPFIFGRGGEEIEKLIAHQVPFEVVPGVTSATAAATYAGIPITHRSFTSTVAFVTGHEDPSRESSRIDWEKLATGAGTIVIYMGIKNLPVITEKLLRHGRDPRTPAAVVRWASTPEQASLVSTLENLAADVQRARIKPPAIIIVGEVVSLRDKLNWYEHRPLFGKRILVTRTREQASELTRLLEEQGAQCLLVPTIRVTPLADLSSLDVALDALEHYDWILFTSPHTVTIFFDRLREKGRDCRALFRCRIGAVGAATAQSLARHGLTADLVPDIFTGDALAQALVAIGVAGKRVLLPRAKKARETLPATLSNQGAVVDIVPLYENTLPREQVAPLQEAMAQEIDCVTFTSSSTATHFIDLLEKAGHADPAATLRQVAVAAIGPITAATLKKRGVQVRIMPQQHTIPGLASALTDYFSGGKQCN